MLNFAYCLNSVRFTIYRPQQWASRPIREAISTCAPPPPIICKQTTIRNYWTCPSVWARPSTCPPWSSSRLQDTGSPDLQVLISETPYAAAFKSYHSMNRRCYSRTIFMKRNFNCWRFSEQADGVVWSGPLTDLWSRTNARTKRCKSLYYAWSSR